MIRKICLLLFALPVFAFEGKIEPEGPVEPWFTGPILASSGNIVPVGHINVQPYFAAIARTSFYNNQWQSTPIDTLWNLRFIAPFWVGLTEWADFRVGLVTQWNERNGQSQWVFCDCSAQLDIQIHKDRHENWLPAMKLTVREVFPTGPYQNLNPNKLGTDGGGDGCYRTWFAFNSSKIIHLRGCHFLNVFFDVAYSIATDVHVTGYNAYGGGMGTNGVISAENIFLAIVAFEYALSRNWAIACDAQAVVTGSTGFTGTVGMMPSVDGDIEPMGIPAANDRKASVQYSLAPAIEYNWSTNLGLILGAYFTVAGKNSSHFTSAVLSLNYFH